MPAATAAPIGVTHMVQVVTLECLGPGGLNPSSPKKKKKKKALESGGFGGGFVQKELQITSNTPISIVNIQEEETQGNHENVESALLYDFTCAIEKLASSYAEVDEKSRELFSRMPNHTGVKKVITVVRRTFNLSSLVDDIVFIDSNTKPMMSMPTDTNETTPQPSQDAFFNDPTVLKDLDALMMKVELMFQQTNDTIFWPTDITL